MNEEIKQRMLSNKRSSSLKKTDKTPVAQNELEFNFSSMGTTRLAKQSTIKFDAINESPERPTSAGSEPCFKETCEHTKQLNMFEKLIQYDYEH